MQDTATLTAAQQKLADHIAAGGVVTRAKNAPEGKGYSAEGIKMILPATIEKLIDLGIMERIADEDDNEVYAAAPTVASQPKTHKPDLDAIAESSKWKGGKVSKKQEPEEPVEEPEPEEEEEHEAVEEKPVEPADILMWVGGSSYPDIDSFVQEAADLGISKRMSKLPRDIIPGRSRMFFAHDEGVKGDAVIFGYTVIGRLEVIADEVDQIPVNLRQRAFQVTTDQAADEAERGCGHRYEIGAMYAVAYSDDEQQVLLDSTETVTAHGRVLAVFNEPLDYNALVEADAKRFRSYKRVEGDKLLDAVGDPEFTKARPAERARENLTVDLPEELLNRDPRSRWTDDEREVLFGMVEKYDSAGKGKAQAFRDFAFATGRSPQGAAYQYQQHVAKQK